MGLQPGALELAASLIEQFEGIELKAYEDPIGIPTICAGITRYPSGKPVTMGDTCSAEVCRAYLMGLLRDEYIPGVSCIPGFGSLSERRQAVLLSFAWNLGARFYEASGFETISSVLKRGFTDPAAYKEVPAALLLYDKAGGKALVGLTKRRQIEASLWVQEDHMIAEFQCVQDTFLKKAPIDSKYLSDLGKELRSKDSTIKVARVEEIPADSHAWWTLEDGSRWAVFEPHWRPHVSGPRPPAAPVDWNNFGAQVGKYITVGEVLQYDSRRKPRPGSPEEKSILEICRQFDAIREAWNGPIGVTSGYRPEPINTQVGGAPNSYHVRGQALDIYPIGEPIEAFHHWLVKRWTGGYGDGRKKGFIHLDLDGGHGKFSKTPNVRPSRIWDY
jgi:GH24 family phage-related lysozyme (muramidase)